VERLEQGCSREDEHRPHDQRAENSDVLEHLPNARAFFRRFGFGKFLSEEHQAVGDCGHEIKRELNFPAHLHFVVENPANDRAENHSQRPTRMEDVQKVRAVMRIKGGHKRIGDSFESSVRKSEDEHAPR